MICRQLKDLKYECLIVTPLQLILEISVLKQANSAPVFLTFRNKLHIMFRQFNDLYDFPQDYTELKLSFCD